MSAPAAPQNVQAEQSVLGGVLIAPEAFWSVSDSIQEPDFSRRDHQMIWRAITELHGQGQAPDAVTLGEWFEAKGVASLVGGARYILELAATTPGASNIKAYAKIVADCAVRRRLIEASGRIAKLAADPNGMTIDDVSEEARRLLADTMPLDARAVTTASQAVQASVQRITERFHATNELSGLDTGIGSLNDATGGLQRKRLYILAARPSMGKSLVAGNIVEAAVIKNKRVAIFSIEMSADEWTDRFISALSGVDTELLARPKYIAEHCWPKIMSSVSDIKNWDLIIDDSGAQSLLTIQSRAMQMYSVRPLDMIVIDHLGLIDVADEKNVARQVGLITKGLKAIAKRLDIPVLLLCQLNRDGATGKEPTMTDLRESGRIEEDADGVFMLHRPAYYESSGQTPTGYTKCLVRKLRDGKLRTLHWDVDLTTMRVKDGCELPDAPVNKWGGKKTRPGF